MIDEDPPPIVTEITGSIAIVRFNRPTQRNPLSLDTLQELGRTTSALFPRNDIQAVIFIGSDDVFASGANIRELAQLDSKAALKFSRLGQELFQTIADARQITIAAINGYCMGGGLDLALGCDIRVASKGAVFSHPGAKLGIITGWGGTQRLPRVIGRARALEFFATARRYSSADALEMGLINRVGDPVIECAIECVREASALASPSSGIEQFLSGNPQSSGQ
ncbi:MAG TPA: enoyl-CoA hydratase [Blastocatellia bacterium]|jgi:enoyl-CoA hydratase|nr:enoyl-CoA hydratase [Blastocatellia bacterium]HAF24272.1 enoyl-CoA hydratase [Blastocatellia bacterium]HCX29737.1 enoyl-CoA hydratase [Blastocatellia bacterium]